MRKSFVIFICTYDPFGKGSYAYTFENRCREDLSLALGDETTKIILNAKGRTGEVSAALKELLRYVNGAAPGDDYTRELDNAVTEIRMDKKWRREYMVLNEMLRANRRLGRYADRVAMVRALRDEFQPEQLIKIAFNNPELLQAILDAIDAHPDWDDEQIAESVDFD